MPAALLVALLEFSSELSAAIDMHGSDGECHLLLEAVEKLRGGGSGRTRLRLQNVPARDVIARSEVFPDYAGHRSHDECIDLGEITGIEVTIFIGFSHRIGPQI